MEKPFVIIINGSINSGKTSVSKALQRLIPELAHIEVDDIGTFIQWMPLEQRIPLNLKSAGLVGRVFLDAGIPVVISYPLMENEHSALVQALAPYPSHTFTLSPPLEIAQSNRGTRSLEPRESERIAYHYKIGIPKPSFGMIIDNGGGNPEDSALRIWNAVRGA